MPRRPLAAAILYTIAAHTSSAPLTASQKAAGWRDPPRFNRELSRQEFDIVCETLRQQLGLSNKRILEGPTCGAMQELLIGDPGMQVRFFVANNH